MESFNIGFSIRPKIGIIYEFQKQNNLTSKALAELIGVPYAWFNNTINMTVVPKTNRGGKNIKKLLDFFQCRFEELFPTQNLKMLAGEHSLFQDIPIDKLVSWDNNRFDLLPAPPTNNICIDETIKEILKTLEPREAEVIKMRYGIDKDRTYTLDEIGASFGICLERVRQIELKALRKMRHPLRANKLKPFI